MRINRKQFIRILFLPFFLSFVASPNAMAWGKYGHVTICEIAYRTTTDTARLKINQFIQAEGQYSSFNRACLFADRHPRTRGSAHYINYPRDLASVESGDCPGDNECLISAIEDDLYKLTDSSLSDAERGKAMILLGHWVGDLHQPLHVSFSDDRGGNSIKKTGVCAASNLHAVWDSCIVERRVLLSKRLAQERGWSTFTRAYRAADGLLENVTDEDISGWGSTDLHVWAGESFDLARAPEVGYCEMLNGSCVYSSGNPTLDEGEEQRVIEMDNEYLDAHSSTVAMQLTKAGIRLGLMLAEALDP